MGVNILESCVSYNVNILNCTNEVSTKLREIYQPEPEEIYVRVSKNLIDAFDVPSDAIDWESYELDEDLLYGILVELLGNHPYYLVFASGCKWNGASGYKFYDDILKTCERSYEISLTLEEEGKDAIKCMESSHDVPTGSPTYIIGLSYDDYERLNEAEFDEIRDFAESKF